MFSKGRIIIIILLFLGMLMPLILDSFGIDIIEGAGPTSGSSLGGVGMKSAVGKAAEDAKRAKASLDAELAAKAKGKMSAITSTESEDIDFAELFTNRTNEFAYAYVTESFVEGAASNKPAACTAFTKLIANKENHVKLKSYINGPMSKWHNKKCK